MTNQDSIRQVYAQVLLQNDSAGKYFPDCFEIQSEYRIAVAIAVEVERITGCQATTEDPSGYQDGSLFTKIDVADAHKRKLTTIYLSSFGRLATVEFAASTIEMQPSLLRLLEQFKYTYIPMDALENSYSGTIEEFKRHTWFYRYFCAFYVIDE
jgi:hypothetical protein